MSLLKSNWILKTIIFTFLTNICLGQITSPSYATARQTALGGTMAMADGISSTQGNPAGLGLNTSNTSIIFNSDSRFFLSSVRSTFLGFSHKIADDDYIGVSLGTFGISEFREQKAALSYSKRIGKNIYLGTSFKYYNYQIEEYTNRNTFDLGLGIRASLTKDLTLGIHADNILPSSGEGQIHKQLLLSLGISYIISKKVILTTEFQKVESGHKGMSLGVAYQLLDNLEILLGVNTIEVGQSFGLSYSIDQKFKLMASVRSIQNLGLSPSVGLVYQFGM